jgi:hypothetical protein
MSYVHRAAFHLAQRRAVGEDVAALVLFGCFGCVLHSPSPRGAFLCKVFETEEMSLDLEVWLFPSCG